MPQHGKRHGKRHEPRHGQGHGQGTKKEGETKEGETSLKGETSLILRRIGESVVAGVNPLDD